MNSQEQLKAISEVIEKLHSIKPILRGDIKTEFWKFMEVAREFLKAQKSLTENDFLLQERVYFRQGYGAIKHILRIPAVKNHLNELGFKLDEWNDGLPSQTGDIDTSSIKNVTSYLTEVVKNLIDSTPKTDENHLTQHLSNQLNKDELHKKIIESIWDTIDIEEIRREAKNISSEMKMHKELVGKQVASISRSISEAINDARSSIESQKVKMIGDSLAGIESDFDKKIHSRAESKLSLIDTLSTQADEALSGILSKIEKSQKIYSLLSQELTKEHYGQACEQERTQRNSWRNATLLLFLLTLIGLFGLTYSSSDLNDLFLRKLPFALVSLLAIGYCGRQAAKHHSAERFYQQMQFEFLTLDSYLLGLTDEEARAVRRELSASFFGNATKGIETPDSNSANTSSIKDLIDLVKEKIK